MKKILSMIFLTSILSIFLFGTALSFTYEGELNPYDFSSWTIVDKYAYSAEIFWVILKNPDQTSPIDRVATALHVNGDLLAYQYIKGSKVYAYNYDKKQDRFIQVVWEEEDEKACMECHNSEETFI